MVNFYQINLEEVITFQCDTNLFATEEDMASSDWVKDILVNLSEAVLSQCVDNNFQRLEPLEQGGIT